MLDGYIGRIRSKIGSDLFIHPAARIIIENEKGEFLFIVRMDNGKAGLPAGGLEENESILECIIREAREETGLEISDVQFIGLSTHPDLELTHYPNGDRTQYFTAEFYTNQYHGNLFADGIETRAIGWHSAEHIQYLPPSEQSTFESLKIWKATGQVHLR